ncbi:hypothetical protein DPMN_153217 [Dreissena polymorpha]|uniref:Uncharacterized protein n=1 Tax=Dreissena polymorpha TaxID=45954 RepID=A0A9D4FKD4_DREPO|nr:hypothetical protein DPMN_153217 [Dreissena polymorpha]
MSARHQQTGTWHQGSLSGWKRKVRRQKQGIRTATGHQDSNRALGQQQGIGTATGHWDSNRASEFLAGRQWNIRTATGHQDSKMA